jgi:hypothetical protein
MAKTQKGSNEDRDARRRIEAANIKRNYKKNLDQTGQAANIRQNTRNQGYQQDR